MAKNTKKAESEVTEEVVQEVAEAPAFTKKQIVKSRKYARWVDWLNANLDADKKYTHAELADMLLKNFKVTIKY